MADICRVVTSPSDDGWARMRPPRGTRSAAEQDEPHAAAAHVCRELRRGEQRPAVEACQHQDGPPVTRDQGARLRDARAGDLEACVALVGAQVLAQRDDPRLGHRAGPTGVR